MTTLKLFMLPFAGGSAQIAYQGWKEHLPSSIQMIPIDPPGRGRRLMDPLAENLDEMLADLYLQVCPHLDGTPFAIFGHSLGCLLGYELAHRLIERGHGSPQALFLSGKKPPHRPVDVTRYNMSRTDFKRTITEMGGTAEEILDNDELFEFFEPMIRADFKLVDTYEYREKPRALACPIYIFNGLSDPLTSVEHMDEWKSYTTGPCTVLHYEGGHFFLNEHAEGICLEISNNFL
ncbi:thioesterase [Tumebacillus sp. ITR2]|uniref:Thioesterase n=1 Tax=Tumebacillus amylolyticus TaxID=2801339 RepID=A0ABS1JG19_9BACL|nr:alpha/beta fold hydrolase [Tumebacillus amylolyticus]MBL0389219.1 thioesterase [Tumebacillus amylolyticus]